MGFWHVYMGIYGGGGDASDTGPGTTVATHVHVIGSAATRVNP